MEVEHLKNMGQRLLSAVGIAGTKTGPEIEVEIKGLLLALRSAVDACAQPYAGQTSLATDQDVRVENLCNQWLKVLMHGIKIPTSTYLPLQNIIAVGLNLAFNMNLLDAAIWNYTKLHMTRHEELRFNLLKTVNTPLGFFKAFVRSALNEKSFERYLESWIGHRLISEFYEDWAIVRNVEHAKTLPKMAAELSSIFFALSIDKAELNESQFANQSPYVEPIITLPEPIAKSNANKRISRQIISFDNGEKKREKVLDTKSNLSKTSNQTEIASTSNKNNDILNSDQYSAVSIKDTTHNHSTIEHSSKNKTNFDSQSQGSDNSSIIEEGKKNSESDIDDILLEGHISCLELELPDHLATEKSQPSSCSKEEEIDTYVSLKISQIEDEYKQKSSYMENVIDELRRENNKLNEQLRNYVSAVKELDRNDENEEVKHYEAKLVQVAQMHAELMEFNQMLQRQLQSQIEPFGIHYPLPSSLGVPDTLVNIWIPSAYLVSKGSKSFHIYQVFLKVGADDWNVYRRYSEFRKLYSDLKNLHPDISFFKFPPKKAIGKKESWVVEQRRCQLQGWLRHIVHSLPQLHQSATKKDLISYLPFLRDTGSYENAGTLRPVLTT